VLWRRHGPATRSGRDKVANIGLTLQDFANETILVWTGAEKLFRHETVMALLQRYVDILARAAD
jgi:hypothetical protein